MTDEERARQLQTINEARQNARTALARARDVLDVATATAMAARSTVASIANATDVAGAGITLTSSRRRGHDHQLQQPELDTRYRQRRLHVDQRRYPLLGVAPRKQLECKCAPPWRCGLHLQAINPWGRKSVVRAAGRGTHAMMPWWAPTKE
jgi:hypothetical protein